MAWYNSVDWGSLGGAAMGAGAAIYGANKASDTIEGQARSNQQGLVGGLENYNKYFDEGLGFQTPWYGAGLSALDRYVSESQSNPYLSNQQDITRDYGSMNTNIPYPDIGDGQITLGGQGFQAGQLGVTRDQIMNDPSFNIMKDMGMENSAKRASAMGMRNSSSRLDADQNAIQQATLATRDRLQDQNAFNIGQDWQAQQANYGMDVENFQRQAALGDKRYQAGVDDYTRRAGQLNDLYNMQGGMGQTSLGALGNLANMGLSTGTNLMSMYNNRGVNELNAQLGMGGMNTTLAQATAGNQSDMWNNVGGYGFLGATRGFRGQ